MDWRVAGRIWIAAGLALACLPGLAGEAQGPVSHLTGPHLPLSDVEVWSAPVFDYRAAAAAPTSKGEAVQVGRRFPVDVTTSNAGTWETASRSDRLWRMRLTSPGALWMVLGFDRFELQAGATLYLVGQDGKHTQLYTSDDVQPHGQLWTAPVPGDDVVLELHWPRNLSRQDPGLHLAYVSHGFRPFGAVGREATDKSLGSSGSCNIDVACPQADDWRDELRGVVLILKNGSAACTGSLISNTSQDCTNYVLTAAHCFNAGEAPSLVFQFNFERPGCGSGAPGPTQIVTGGATFRARSDGSDFYLAEMLGDIPASYNPYYNGWSWSASAPTESTGIHHPSGDAKKITFNTDTLTTSGSYWYISEWEEGTTEPGSSGSPLFNEDQLIVGQLCCGDASCLRQDEWDAYGKLSLSWNSGGTPATRLRDWLDPADTGVVALPGLDVTQCGAGAALLTLQQSQTDDGPGGNGDGTIDPGENIVLTALAANNGGADATAVVGTLTTSTPGVSIPVWSANFPNIPSGTSATSLAPHFQIQTIPTFECGATIDLNLSLDSAESAFPTSTPISLATGIENITTDFTDDAEQGSTDWTIQSPQGNAAWALSTADSNSPTTSWFVPDTGSENDQILLLDTFANLAADRELVFQHRFNTEPIWDGGVLEHQVSGGSWLDAGALITSGGYNGTITTSSSSNLAGRDAWVGSNGGWTEVRVDLSSLVGDDVRFRWRMATDGAVTGEGWYVDDVQLLTATTTCLAAPPGEASGEFGNGAQLTIQYGRDLFTLAWSAPPTGPAPTGYRLYATPLFSAYAPTCEAELSAVTAALLPGLTDNSGFLMVAVNGTVEGPYGTESTGAGRQPATGTDVCP